MSIPSIGVAFLLTYTVQSTLLILLCWIGVSLFRSLRPEHRGLLWKFALLGGVVTSLLPFSGLIPNWGVCFNIAEHQQFWPSAGDIGPIRTVVPALGENSVVQVSDSELTSEVGWPIRAWNLTSLLAVGWFIVATGGLLHLSSQYVGLYFMRRSAKRVRSKRILAMVVDVAERVGVRAPIELYRTTRDEGPLVVGLFRKRIFVASEFLECLDQGQLHALLAHELAHVAKRDPWWNLTSEIVRRVFFFQPLNLLACRQIRIEAEYVADRVTATVSSGFDLARCLESLTEWSRARRFRATPTLAVGVGSFRSLLGRRVALLLNNDNGANEPDKKSLILCSATALVLLSAMTTIGPHLIAASPIERDGDAGETVRSQLTSESQANRLIPIEAVGFDGVVEGIVGQKSSGDSFAFTVSSVEEYSPDQNSATNPVTLTGQTIDVRLLPEGRKYQNSRDALARMDSGKRVRISIRHEQGREFQLLGTFRQSLLLGYKGFRGTVSGRVEELDPRSHKIAVSVQRVGSKFQGSSAQQPWMLRKQRILVEGVSATSQQELRKGDQIEIAINHVEESRFRFDGGVLRSVATPE